MNESIHVGFLGGTELPGNVQTLLSNLRRLLKSADTTFACDLLVPEGIETPEDYRTVQINHEPVETARDRLRVLYQAVTQYAAAEQPDVLVQVTRFPTHGSAVALAGRKTDTPTVTRLAGDNFREHQFATNFTEKLRTFALQNMIELAALHLSDAAVVPRPHGSRDLERRFRRSDVWEIPQPVDHSRFSPGDASDLRESLGIGSNERMLLTVGRVSRRKGAETIQRVAPSCDGTWVVVGDGPMRETLQDTTGVYAPGRIFHEKIVDYYRAADLYVHPSLHEGLPNVLLEATACGTPCIARNVGECATVAVETFTDETELQAVLDQSYESVELGDRFADDRLAEQYESLLLEVAC
jgi:glycosyltransferase involved in cell wall biosynthesis